MELLLTALGAFLGALLSILASIAIEYQRKPKLHLSIESPTWENTFPGAIKSGTFLKVYLSNEPVPKLLRCLGRSAAYQCTGEVQFYHLNETPVFPKPMPAHLADGAELREHFEREARTTAILNYPHIDFGARCH